MTEWDHRQLCSDGACIGVIGSDGTCKVCGRAAPNWGDERKRGMLDEPAEDDEDDEDDEGQDDDLDESPGEGIAASAASGDPEWEQRRLCPDDACIGVLDATGKCKVCGRGAA